MKRVLIFSLAYYPKFIGGDAVAIKEITDRIEPRDIEFHMITLRFDSLLPKEEKIGNVTVHRIGFGRQGVRTAQTFTPLFYLSKIFFVPLAVWTARSLHRQQHFDALWAMMSYMLLPIVLLRISGVRTPYVLTLQEGDPYEKVFYSWHIIPFLPLLDWGFRHAAVVQTISTFLADWARRRGFKGPLEVIPNGSSVDLSHIYLQEELSVYKQKVGKKENDVFIVSVSRLVHKNGVDTLVRALPLLPEHIKLLLVGDGPDKEMLQKLATDLGVATRVVYSGHVDTSETAKYRTISDIFARPSRSEGMGNSFASAMASKLPIIATQEGGLRDFIFDKKHNPDKEQTAWVVEKDRPEQIAAVVKEILANPEQVKEVTEHCYKLVATTYNWEVITKNMREKVFSRVLQDE